MTNVSTLPKRPRVDVADAVIGSLNSELARRAAAPDRISAVVADRFPALVDDLIGPPDDGVDSVTLSANGQSVTLTQEHARSAPVRPALLPPVLDEDEAFAEDHDLDRAVAFLRFSYPELVNASVTVLWKAKGGRSNGKNTLGKCQKASGLLGYFVPSTFVIWLAADHLRGKTTHQIEAVLYHELKHIGLDDNGDPCVVAHDFTGFLSELDRYGCYLEDLAIAKAHFEQARLPGVV